MTSIKKDSDPLGDFTEEQFANLDESINTLDQEDKRWSYEQREEEEIRGVKIPFRRLRKSPLEIVNRLFFFFFLASFLSSFAFIYSKNPWWFLGYLVSAFSCILYPPNRKALKELIAAWPNVEDLIKNRSLWRK